jgi:hypothetical protein
MLENICESVWICVARLTFAISDAEYLFILVVKKHDFTK